MILWNLAIAFWGVNAYIRVLYVIALPVKHPAAIRRSCSARIPFDSATSHYSMEKITRSKAFGWAGSEAGLISFIQAKRQLTEGRPLNLQFPVFFTMMTWDFTRRIFRVHLLTRIGHFVNRPFTKWPILTRSARFLPPAMQLRITRALQNLRRTVKIYLRLTASQSPGCYGQLQSSNK